MSLAAVAVLVGLAWVLVTGWRARHDLIELRHDIALLRSDLTAGDDAAARHELVKAQRIAAAAHACSSGPAWWIGSRIPGIGSPLRTIRGISAVAEDLSRHALPAVVSAGSALDPRELRVGPDVIDLARLTSAEPALNEAVQDVAIGVQRVEALSSSWLAPVASGRRTVLTELSSLHGTLNDTLIAARVTPTMLGGTTPQRYLVAFLGDNEARGIGGILGGYGVLVAANGRMTFQDFGTDSDLEGASADIDLGPSYDQLYQAGNGAYDFVANADLSPHFPYAARIWSSMWEQRFGEPLDGVIAIDPSTMAATLRLIGNVRLPDGTVLTSQNLVRELEVTPYERFGSDVTGRKLFLVAIARAVSQALLDRSFSATALLRILATAAGQHRLSVYSGDPTDERLIAETPLGGAETITSRPYAEVIVNNAAATKLDYYLQRSETYQRHSCAAGAATVTVRLTNDAPADGLPPYVTGGSGMRSRHEPPGTNQLLVSLYGTEHSYVTGATLDGRPQFIMSGQERGHPVSSALVTLGPGQTRELVFQVHEPVATGPVLIPVQPLDRPMAVTAVGPRC